MSRIHSEVDTLAPDGPLIDEGGHDETLAHLYVNNAMSRGMSRASIPAPAALRRMPFHAGPWPATVYEKLGVYERGQSLGFWEESHAEPPPRTMPVGPTVYQLVLRKGPGEHLLLDTVGQDPRGPGAKAIELSRLTEVPVALVRVLYRIDMY